MNIVYRSAFYAFALLVAVFSSAVASSAKSALSNPETGVVCDKFICADKDGVSIDLTKKHLGEAAAKAVQSQGEFDVTEFTYANGVFCDTNAQACYVDRYFDADGKHSAVDADITAQLFGG